MRFCKQEAFMSKERKNIRAYQKASNDTFASVVHSLGDVNKGFRALAVESVGRTIEIQSQIATKAYETYISEIAKLGRLFFAGYSTFTALRQEQPHANLNEKQAPDKPQHALAEAKANHKTARRGAAAHSVATKRKTETVAKRRSGAKRSTRAKR
jgi:hypothetical protein